MCRIFAVDLRYYSIKSFTPCFLFSERKIEVFMTQYRNIEGSTITPKLHILEDHVIPFITHYRHGLELFGEQGGEKLHHVFNKIHVRSNCVPGNQGDKLTAALKTHLAHVAPEFFVH